MLLRNNAFNRYQPDAYGNSLNSMTPPGTIRPSSNLNMRSKDKELSSVEKDKKRRKFLDHNKTMSEAKDKADLLKEQEAPEFEKTDFDYAGATTGAMQAGISGYQSGKQSGGSGGGMFSGMGKSKGYSGYKSSAGEGAMSRADWKAAGKPTGGGAATAKGGGAAASGGGKSGGGGGGGFSAGGGAAVAAGTALVGAAGAQQSANKNEDVGGAMSGAATGASIGMTLGPIGAAAGAVIGGVAGYFSGKGAKEKREKAEKKAAAARERHNAAIREQKRKIIGKATEKARYQRVMNEASRYDAQGNLRYKKGGVLRYGIISVNEIASIKAETEKRDEPTPEAKPRKITHRYEKGGTLLGRETKPTKVIFKKNGSKTVPVFRRGGKIDVAKTNVIVDGPSHDEENNTSVKGDRGLPVVKNGAKVAEIESKELVINKESTLEIEKLAKEAKKNPEAKKKLGELVNKELADNTFDYSELMTD